jgi:hypothetical protein
MGVGAATHTFIDRYIYIYIYICMSLYLSICIYIYIYLYICICIYREIYLASVYTCIYIYVSLYLYISRYIYDSRANFPFHWNTSKSFPIVILPIQGYKCLNALSLDVQGMGLSMPLHACKRGYVDVYFSRWVERLTVSKGVT